MGDRRVLGVRRRRFAFRQYLTLPEGQTAASDSLRRAVRSRAVHAHRLLLERIMADRPVLRPEEPMPWELVPIL